MEASHWLNRWQANNINGFHLQAANPHLVSHLPALGLSQGDRVFVPLCGKTLDLPWLAAQGYRAVGAELSPLAVEQFFQELGATPTIKEAGSLKLYQVPSIDLYLGDIFELTPALLGPVDAIYDRAALVALPLPMRERYCPHLMALTKKAPQLLLTYTYDQSIAPGPPFSISEAEVHGHYDAHYQVTQLAKGEVEGGLRGTIPATETVWQLKAR